LERVFSKTSCFHGSYLAVGLKCIMRINSLWHLKGTKSRSLQCISGIRCLWSLCSVNVSRPYRYLVNFSHAQTAARHSFSICA
jgi:hypothetical protein